MRAGSGSARRTGHALWAGARADATPTNGPRLPAGRLAGGHLFSNGFEDGHRATVLRFYALFLPFP